MKKQQSGFTLIELIMVIVVLGILAAFALPRFADFGSQARESAVQGAAGAVRSASSIAHAAFLAGNNAAATSVTLEGQTINLENGWPTAQGIIDAAQVDGGDLAVTVTPGTATAAGTALIQASGATTGTTCQVLYTESAAANTAPVIDVDTSDCD